MIKSILTAAATVAMSVAPAFASEPPKVFSGSYPYTTVPPSIGVAYDTVSSPILCRSKARSKFFELAARDMSREDSNTQWATVGNMKVVVWCVPATNQAITAVSGYSVVSVNELIDVVRTAF